MLSSSVHDVVKFFSTFKLSEEEKILFARKYRKDLEVMKALLYYQYGYENVYRDENNFKDNYVRLVLSYGQNNNKGSERK